MTTRDDEPTTEELELLALDALPPGEAEALEERVALHPAAARELAELREALTQGFVGEEVPPSPHVRDDLLAAVRETPQVPAAGGRRAPGTSRRALLGLGAGLALAAGTAGVVVLTDLPDRFRERTPTEEVLEASDVRREQTRLGSGRLVVASSREVGRSVVLLEDVDDPGERRDYQAWLVHTDGSVSSAGVLHDEEGRFTGVLPEGVDGATGVALTEEPQGGSEQPTSEPLGVVEL